jgi:RNA polymerase sigma-70 factor (ECF subfamily)
MLAVAPSSAPDVAEMYCTHRSWLHAWLQRRLDDSGDAADLTQDTFIRVLTSRHAEAPRESRALLTHIAKGLLVDHWRRRDVERAYLEAVAHLPEPQQPSPETRLLLIEALIAVETMLASLPPLTRRLFLMAQLDGLTLAQIAEQSGKPVITVRRHIQRALLACMKTQ